jgi:hypothetical protein
MSTPCTPLLKADGSGKAEVEPNKRMIGGNLGMPIILAPPNDLAGLAICEGIEDGLTVHQATGLGVWAAASAGHMPALADVIPTYVKSIRIYAHEGDPKDAGRKGALALAEGLRLRNARFSQDERLASCTAEIKIEGLR